MLKHIYNTFNESINMSEAKEAVALDKMTKKQLQVYLKGLGAKGISKMKKDELLTESKAPEKSLKREPRKLTHWNTALKQYNDKMKLENPNGYRWVIPSKNTEGYAVVLDLMEKLKNPKKQPVATDTQEKPKKMRKKMV